MILATTPSVNTLGEYVYQAIEKQFKKTLKWEKLVEKYPEPEALHQMRTGMRRLSTIISKYAPALELPKPVSDNNFRKIQDRLGKLNNLDVLKKTLEKLYLPHLPSKEQEILKDGLSLLHQQRMRAVSDLLVVLKKDRYKFLQQALVYWLEEPTYKPLAFKPIHLAIPDLLLPEVSCFLLHQGWFVGTQFIDSKIVVAQDFSASNISLLLAESGNILNSLRQQAMYLRYQMELFVGFYGKSYAAYVAEIKNLQKILGLIQDNIFLTEWIACVFNFNIEEQLPTFGVLLAENRYQFWQWWKLKQEQYLQSTTNERLYQTILRPSLLEQLQTDSDDKVLESSSTYTQIPWFAENQLVVERIL